MRVLLFVAILAPCVFGNPIANITRADTCGVNKYDGTRDMFIVGGQTATPNSWPWQVSLQTSMGHMCGGSIIGPQHILTAAHCFGRDPYAYQWTVVVGKHNLNSVDRNEKRYSVSQIYKHQYYSETNSQANDIALLYLSSPITYNDDVKPVCVPAKTTGDLVNAMVTVTGWGAMYSGGNVASTLQQVSVPVMANSQCQSDYSSEKIQPSMICAGYQQGGKDACQGDSGGPLVTKSNGVWIQVGIVSWGYGCADAYQPGVYTRVSSFIDWIYQSRF